MEIPIGEYKLRSWSLADKAAVARYANNRKIWRNLREVFPYPYTQDDAARYLYTVVDRMPETHFAIATPHEAIGAIALVLGQDVAAKSAEIGYWLGEAYWGRGIATAAVRALVEYGFGTFGIVRIWAEVFEWNPASIRVLEKAGFAYEARIRKSVYKDGQVIDKVIYALIRE